MVLHPEINLAHREPLLDCGCLELPQLFHALFHHEFTRGTSSLLFFSSTKSSTTFCFNLALSHSHFTSKGTFVMKALYLLVGFAYGSRQLPPFFMFLSFLCSFCIVHSPSFWGSVITTQVPLLTSATIVSASGLCLKYS